MNDSPSLGDNGRVGAPGSSVPAGLRFTSRSVAKASLASALCGSALARRRRPSPMNGPSPVRWERVWTGASPGPRVQRRDILVDTPHRDRQVAGGAVPGALHFHTGAFRSVTPRLPTGILGELIQHKALSDGRIQQAPVERQSSAARREIAPIPVGTPRLYRMGVRCADKALRFPPDHGEWRGPGRVEPLPRPRERREWLDRGPLGTAAEHGVLGLGASSLVHV